MLLLTVHQQKACRYTGSHSGGEVTASVVRNWKVSYCVYRWDITEPGEFSLYCTVTALWHILITSVCLHIRGDIQNIPDWCRHLYRSCGSTKNLSLQCSTAKFCGDCVKTREDVAPNFGGNRPGCFTMTTPRLTLPFSPSSFWRKTKCLSSPTHRTPLTWHSVNSSYFQEWNWSWKDAGLIPVKRSRPNRRVLDTLTVKDFQEAFQKLRRRWDQCLHAGGNYFEVDGSR
jgi:hypothetical protein